MSFFGEEDAFSFLHDNYRDRSDDDESDDDESDASSSDGEEDDEQSCTYVGVAPQSPVSVPDSPCDNQGDESQEDSDGEPSPWKGSKAKKRIITVEGGEEHMTSFVSLLENCFEGISEEGGQGRGEDPFEDGEENEEESVGVDADDISDPNTAPSMPFSAKKILRDGLIYAGFTDERIDRCGEKRKIDRFKAHYGVCPQTLVLFFRDLFKKHPSLKYKDVFMTIYWLKTYSVAHVMAATWDRCEEYINPVLEEYIAKFASLKEGKIRMTVLRMKQSLSSQSMHATLW